MLETTSKVQKFVGEGSFKKVTVFTFLFFYVSPHLLSVKDGSRAGPV